MDRLVGGGATVLDDSKPPSGGKLVDENLLVEEVVAEAMDPVEEERTEWL